jgi:hypothetical protein
MLNKFQVGETVKVRTLSGHISRVDYWDGVPGYVYSIILDDGGRLEGVYENDIVLHPSTFII